MWLFLCSFVSKLVAVYFLIRNHAFGKQYCHSPLNNWDFGSNNDFIKNNMETGKWHLKLEILQERFKNKE